MASSSATTPIDTSDKDVETVAAHAEHIDNVAPKPKRGTKRPVRCIPIDTDSDSPSDITAVKVRGKGRKRSEVWDHFTLFLKNEEKREEEVCPDECENMDDWQNVVESQFERDVSSEVVNDRKNDLDKYLEDAREVNSKKFEVLDWWRKHEEVYPTLALMARDVLAIPVTTAASESAFSTGGRVLDPFRSCLSSKMVEGLVCTQDWLRCGNGPLIIEECVEEVEKFDKELTDASDESTVCDDECY